MIGNSRTIAGAQRDVHPRLGERIARHRSVPWRRPVAEHSRRAFHALVERLDPRRPIVLDAGCGTGASTALLARRHPDAEVVGIDKSAYRLREDQEGPANLHLLRADLQDVWRLACEQGWQLLAHYLLYPNPWPKAEHLQRRWHGHPVFPALLALGGTIELRTNWAVYAREFAAALAAAGVESRRARIAADATPLTPFERKYLASGHGCHRVIAREASPC